MTLVCLCRDYLFTNVSEYGRFEIIYREEEHGNSKQPLITILYIVFQILHPCFILF